MSQFKRGRYLTKMIDDNYNDNNIGFMLMIMVMTLTTTTTLMSMTMVIDYDFVHWKNDCNKIYPENLIIKYSVTV